MTEVTTTGRDHAAVAAYTARWRRTQIRAPWCSRCVRHLKIQWSKEKTGGKQLTQSRSVLLSGRWQGYTHLPPSVFEISASPPASTKDALRKNAGSFPPSYRDTTQKWYCTNPPDIFPQPHQTRQITFWQADIWYREPGLWIFALLESESGEN